MTALASRARCPRKVSIRIMQENENNNLKHLSFEEYFEDDWRKHFQEKETVQSIMDAAGLSISHDFVQINSRYIIDDNRKAVIALIKRKNTEVLDKLIIDIIAGQSSFEQFLDVVYSIGSACDYRVILYDQNSKNYPDRIYMEEPIMRELIERLDGHLCLYWMSVDATRDEHGIVKINYTSMKPATIHPSSSHISTRRDFEYAELYCYTMAVLTSEGFLGEIEYLQFDGFLHDQDATIDWKEDGMVIEIEVYEDDFIYLFTKRRDEIPSDDCSYDKENNLLTITINIPFQNFVNSLPKDKRSLAYDYYRNVRIGTFVKDLIAERNDDE